MRPIANARARIESFIGPTLPEEPRLLSDATKA
jgi:hypothetical protein